MPPKLSDSDERTLREYLTEILDFHKESADLQRRIIEERLKASDKAFEIFTEEMHRRLDDLNHAHAEKMRDLEKYLPKNIYEQFQHDYLSWKENFTKEHAGLMIKQSSLDTQVGAVMERVDNLEKGSANLSGKFSGGSQAIIYIIGFISVLSALISIGNAFGILK